MKTRKKERLNAQGGEHLESGNRILSGAPLGGSDWRSDTPLPVPALLPGTPRGALRPIAILTLVEIAPITSADAAARRQPSETVLQGRGNAALAGRIAEIAQAPVLGGPSARSRN